MLFLLLAWRMSRVAFAIREVPKTLLFRDFQLNHQEPENGIVVAKIR